MDLQFKTIIINLFPFISTQLAKHGPAVVVTPVLIPQ